MPEPGAQQAEILSVNQLEHRLSLASSEGKWIPDGLNSGLTNIRLPGSSASRFIVLLIALFLLSFFGLLFAKVWSDYHVALRHAEERAQSVASMSAAHLDSVFGGASSLLEMVDAQGDPGQLSSGSGLTGNRTQRLLIVDALGRPLTTTPVPLTPAETDTLNNAATVNWGQRQDGARIIFPSRPGQDAWFAMSRRIKAAAGEERYGVILISAEEIEALLAGSNLTSLLGHGGTVSLVGLEGKIHGIRPVHRSGSQSLALEEVTQWLKHSSQRLDYLKLSSGSFLFARQETGFGADVLVLVPMADAIASLWQSLPLFGGLSIVALLFAGSFGSFLTNEARKVRSTDRLLEDSELLFDLAASSAKCGLWSWNLEREEMFWSSSIMQLLGFDSRGASLTFNEALNLIHPSDRKYLRRVESSMRKGQTGFDTKFRLKHADGHFLWMRARGEVKVTDGERRERRFFGIIIDMTDELMATAREEQARLNLQNAVESISDAFVLWDRNRNPVLTNSKYEDWKPFDSGDAWEALEEAREIERDDGQWIQLKSNRIAGGGVVTVARNITDLKLKNTALEESRSALSDTVKDLKTSRSHLRVLAEKFEEEKRRAEEASRSKTEFLGNMSHELRTPLNAIIGFSEIMETGMFGDLGDPRYEEYAGDIRKAGRGLLELIDDILDMSRIESGKYEVECEVCDAGEMLDDCLRIVETRAEDKNIDVRNDIDLLPDVVADRGAFKHVLVNVISNAIKFTERGGLITLSGQADLQTVTVKIRDNGIGIAADDLKKLGMPFVQFENHREKRYSGSGLGIAISMSLIDMMGGAMVIESQEGQGTEVSISLPRRELMQASD